MQNVTLLGDMGEKFGENWTMEVSHMNDIVKLISCQEPEFRPYLIDAQDKGAGLLMLRGGKPLTDPDEYLLSVGEEDIAMGLLPTGEGGVAMIISNAAHWLYAAYTATPIVAAVEGAAAVYASGFATFAVRTVAQLLIMTAITAISNYLAPDPSTDQDEAEGYLFGGVSNNVQEGVPVPVLYGELMVGGVVINSSHTTITVIDKNVVQDAGGNWILAGS